MRLIDADALLKELNNSHFPGAPYVDTGISIAIGKVLDAPTIEPKQNGRKVKRMAELKPCPFCGSADLYETYSQEYALGTKNPEIFCNSCKIIFSIEDDSPYMNCEEDYVYRKNKTLEAWNRRAKDEQAD